MAKRRRGTRRSRRNFVAIPFSKQLALSTLGNDIVLSGDAITFGEDIYCISVDMSVTIKGQTGGEMPLQVGVCHGDLTVSEIAENLVAELSDPDDIIQYERARRPVRKYGKLAPPDGNPWPMNDGKEIRRKLGFSIGDGHSLDVWVQNLSGATLTTGALVDFDGTLYGRWQR